MREIKFRAWVGADEQKEMSKPFKIFDAERVLNPFFEEPIMQYTGLKDKNRKEIYEGDIVRCYTKSLEEVVYDHEVKLPDFYREIWSEEILEDGTRIPAELDCLCGGVEVIGDIYQNAELLK